MAGRRSRAAAARVRDGTNGQPHIFCVYVSKRSVNEPVFWAKNHVFIGEFNKIGGVNGSDSRASRNGRQGRNEMGGTDLTAKSATRRSGNQIVKLKPKIEDEDEDDDEIILAEMCEIDIQQCKEHNKTSPTWATLFTFKNSFGAAGPFRCHLRRPKTLPAICPSDT